MNSKELLYLCAKSAYYNTETPIMSDFEFDALEAELMSEGSTVVSNVGAESNGTLTKVKHAVSMKSLRKIKIDEADFQKNLMHWIDSNNIEEIEASIKLDGNAVKLIYDHTGRFICALSRGDGEFGFDITDKLIHMGIPKKLTWDVFPMNESWSVEISGEVVISLKTFEEKYADTYKNARNFVSGRLAIDLSRCNEQEYIDHIETFKDLDFVPIDMVAVNHENNTHQFIENTDFFFALGFTKRLELTKYDTAGDLWYDELQRYITFLREENTTYPYLYDGLVLRVANANARKRIGEIDHHPKWAVALKYDSETATTKIIDIEWKIGTNRKLTPVGILEPVELMGTTVQRVSLANLKTMLEKEIYPNSTVTIQKAGDIIPYVISSTPPEYNREMVKTVYKVNPYSLITEFSDITMDELEWDYDDPYNVRYVGESSEVERRKLHKGIKILDIDNIGEATVNLLYDSGIKTIYDLFDKEKFNKENLIASGNFKEGRALEIVLNAVWNKESFDYWRVINALQVDGCGKTMSRELAKYYYKVDYNFSGLEKEVIEYMTDENSKEFMAIVLTKPLIAHGFEIIYPDNPTDNNTQDKKVVTFEMTGSPKTLGWKTKQEFVNSLSDAVKHTKLTKDTDYLITDDIGSNSSKMKKARKYGIAIRDYMEFYHEFYQPKQIN